jgi:NAD(P)-dependent dehydrogenase (short-subunit alcohol dehydrogenase family)
MSRNRSAGGASPDFPEGAAVVIGGSGGVGRAICEGLARAGTDVVLTFRSNQSAASETVEAVRAAGRGADVHRLSVGDAAAVTSFFEGVVADHGRIHTVVNAAGANIAMRFIGEVALEEWREVIESDLGGYLQRGARLAAPPAQGGRLLRGREQRGAQAMARPRRALRRTKGRRGGAGAGNRQ